MRLPEGIGLRAAAIGDLSLLQRIYCSTRSAELAVVDWDEPVKDAFLRQQFDFQHRYYHAHFPDAEFCIVRCDAQDIGRWYLDRTGAQLRLIDIALLPDWRQRGIGSCLLQRLMAQADECGKPVLVHVEANNPALVLYRRLGFEPSSSNGMYVKLTRLPRGAALEERR